MESRIDIQLDDNDIVVSKNDLVLVESDIQHVVDTINANQGWWKENPTDGVGILKYFKGRNVQQELSRTMKLQLVSDGYSARPAISYDSNGQLIINPNVAI